MPKVDTLAAEWATLNNLLDQEPRAGDDGTEHPGMLEEIAAEEQEGAHWFLSAEDSPAGGARFTISLPVQMKDAGTLEAQ